jgi:hypothetical protein
VGGLLGGSCGGDRDGGGVNGPLLSPLASCGEVELRVRADALRQMHARLDAQLASALDGGGGCWEVDADGSGPPSAGPSDGSGGGASQVSGTNNQVAGVDEADFIKNDNRYIYVLGGGKLRILDAWPAATAHTLAAVPVEGTPKKLFVEGDRALVYSALPLPAGGGEDTPYAGSWGNGECTYGYGCAFTGDGHPLRITIFDLTDRAAPVLVRTIETSGSYVNARRIGTAVHTVVSAPGVLFPELRYWPAGLDQCADDVSDLETRLAFASLRLENERAILSKRITDWMPSVKTSRAGVSSENLLGACEDFYGSVDDGSSFTTVLSLDLGRDDSLAQATIVSRPGAVYASSEALYMAVQDELGGPDAAEASTIHKFLLAGAPVPGAFYAGSGVVKGHVLNQFAMDEWRGDLRVATTTGHVPDPNVRSTITVLRPAGAALATVGVLDDLAPQEDIRSVRFAGAQGYVVTFKKTDPLFVFDLSVPERPVTRAELKIPGFSTYMHMMDDRHLLTIGYDADDQGSFAWFSGVMLQIFDVAVPTDPRLVHKEVIGTRGSSSEALTNHLAFNYFAPLDLLALPMTICEGGSGGSYGTDMTFSGLIVYDVTAAGGFRLRGRVDHPRSPAASCSNWWTNASSEVKRSIIMDDYVFSVSDTLVKVNALGALATDVTSIVISED